MLGGTYEIDNSQRIKVSEPKHESDDQDEPNSVERTVITARQHRRLATVNRAGLVKNPRRIHYDDG